MKNKIDFENPIKVNYGSEYIKLKQTQFKFQSTYQIIEAKMFLEKINKIRKELNSLSRSINAKIKFLNHV